ncbi:MAG: hypothetical protein AB1634_00445 [Thermodesulfobacteriota bacterium]
MPRAPRALGWIALALLILAACEKEPAQPPPAAAPAAPPPRVVTAEEKAYALFGDILALGQSADRAAVRPQMEELYRTIIRDYPEMALAQEASWRLLNLLLEDGTPEGRTRAEELYAQFKDRYPGSRFQGLLEKSLAAAGAGAPGSAATAPPAAETGHPAQGQEGEAGVDHR